MNHYMNWRETQKKIMELCGNEIFSNTKIFKIPKGILSIDRNFIHLSLYKKMEVRMFSVVYKSRCNGKTIKKTHRICLDEMVYINVLQWVYIKNELSNCVENKLDAKSLYKKWKCWCFQSSTKVGAMAIP